MEFISRYHNGNWGWDPFDKLLFKITQLIWQLTQGCLAVPYAICLSVPYQGCIYVPYAICLSVPFSYLCHIRNAYLCHMSYAYPCHFLSVPSGFLIQECLSVPYPLLTNVVILRLEHSVGKIWTNCSDCWSNQMLILSSARSSVNHIAVRPSQVHNPLALPRAVTG